ncbi:MAG: histidine kinase [Balneolaceae bacterium]|nr:histidine kinase [Balneolaceae bacterium]
MVLLFSSPSDGYGYRQGLIFVAFLLPVLATTTYFLLYYLVPRYLLRRRFFLFGLFTVFTFIAAAWLELMISIGLFVVVAELQIQQLNPRITDLGYLSGAIAMAILPAVAIHITRQWYRERETSERLKQEKLELELRAREKELDYLKEQIRPHFLFNVLNSLYGLTLEKSDEAPELVLKVSNMLDYMLYSGSDARVPVPDEIEHITNYIDIQKIRCGDRLTVELETDPAEGYTMAPMILLPFVENSFKHGVSQSSSESYVRVSVRVEQGDDAGPACLQMEVINSLVSRQKQEKTGVGLSNTRKRLELLFGEDFDLHTQQTENEYRIRLTIPLTKPSTTHGEMDVHDRG